MRWSTSRSLPYTYLSKALDVDLCIPHIRNSVILYALAKTKTKWALSSEFVSSSIPSWQILTAHAQPFRGARDLAFCLKVPLDSLLVWASSGGSGETVRMRRLAWTFAARIGNKYQIRLTWSKYSFPWIDNWIKRLNRKRDRQHLRGRKSSSPDIKNHYKRFRAHVQKHIGNIYQIFSKLKVLIPIVPRMKIWKEFGYLLSPWKTRRVWDHIA